jgi:nucleotide-binding universal stress UspA family protein
MYPSMLVPLDGSEFSEDALPLARHLASRLGAHMHLVHVIRPAPDAELKSPQADMEWKAKVRDGAQDYLQEIADGMAEDGIETTISILDGRVTNVLDEYARESGIPLVVMTTHGSGGLKRWWLGSVADGLLRKGGTNVLLVRPWDDTEEGSGQERRFQHIIVPLDGSTEAETALGPARELAQLFEAEATLLRVVPAPVELTSIYGVAGVRMEGEGHRGRREEAENYLEEVVNRGGDPVPTAQVVEAKGAADGVIDAARKLEGDLLVLSSHGRGGLSRVVLGSVADKIIRGTTLPVLVIRPPEES